MSEPSPPAAPAPSPGKVPAGPREEPAPGPGADWLRVLLAPQRFRFRAWPP